MANGPVVNQGKTAFVEAHLTDQPDANVDAINTSWAAAGHEGAVSDSLVAKVRARLGLTGRRSAEPPTPAPAAKSKARESAPPRPRDRPEPAAKRSEARTKPGQDDEVLDELEEAIDDLIHRLRVLGGRTDVVKALRRARRLLVRGAED